MLSNRRTPSLRAMERVAAWMKARHRASNGARLPGGNGWTDGGSDVG
jgi:hypothetical protein